MPQRDKTLVPLYMNQPGGSFEERPVQPVECRVGVAEARVDDGDVVRRDVSIVRLLFEDVEHFVRFVAFSGNRIRMTECCQHSRCTVRVRERILKLSDRFFEFSLLLVRSTQIKVGAERGGIEFHRFE